MRATNIQPIIVNDNTGIYSDNSINDSDYPILINDNTAGCSSQIVEPEIVIPIKNTPSTSSNTGANQSASQQQQVQEDILTQHNLGQNTVSTSATSIPNTSNTSISSTSSASTPSTSNPNAVPSATTDQTKNYVGGGTTPDSSITVKKPKPNYLVFGIVGVIGLAVIYKLFFNKKVI